MEVSDDCHSSKKLESVDNEVLVVGLGGSTDHGYWDEVHVLMFVVASCSI